MTIETLHIDLYLVLHSLVFKIDDHGALLPSFSIVSISRSSDGRQLDVSIMKDGQRNSLVK